MMLEQIKRYIIDSLKDEKKESVAIQMEKETRTDIAS